MGCRRVGYCTQLSPSSSTLRSPPVYNFPLHTRPHATGGAATGVGHQHTGAMPLLQCFLATLQALRLAMLGPDITHPCTEETTPNCKFSKRLCLGYVVMNFVLSFADLESGVLTQSCYARLHCPYLLLCFVLLCKLHCRGGCKHGCPTHTLHTGRSTWSSTIAVTHHATSLQ